MNRVVVSGLGVVSPVGSTIEAFWSNLVQGRSGIGPISNIPTERLSCRVAAEVRDFKPEDHFDSRQLSSLDRFAQFAVVAGRQAMADSGLELDEALALTTGVILGTGVGGLNTLDDGFLRLYGQNASRLHPMTIPRLMVNAGASHLSMDLGFKGPVYAIASACASGSHAIGNAFQMVRSGATPVTLAGGAEACITVGTLKGWEALRVMSNDTCRPFSLTRSGMVLGEGAAVLVLEERTRAMARGARIYGEILGFGAGADAGDITTPDVDGAARAMRLALADARLDPDAIGYVNAHGTGTMVNDRIETRALHGVFGAHARSLAISSTKAVLGHGLGAAGALEAAASLLALHHGVIPPTANFEQADPECDLDYVPGAAREARVTKAMSNSFAFGGLNAVLVLGAA